MITELIPPQGVLPVGSIYIKKLTWCEENNDLFFCVTLRSGNPLDPVTTNRYYGHQASQAGIPMTTDKTIFGLRFRSNEKLQPSIDGLRIFLDSPKKEDKGKLHGDDLAEYRDLLSAVESFEHGRKEGFH